MTTTASDLELLVRGLSAQVDNVVAFGVVDSTHRAAIRLLEQMDEEDVPLAETVVTALRQSRGLGRGEHQWESPRGGLYLDWIRSGLRAELVPKLPMLAAASAHHAVTALGVDEVRIKWPNDLVVEGRKLAGVLVQVRHGERISAAVGLGVNLTTVPILEVPSPLPPVAISELIPAPSDRPFEHWAPRLAGAFVKSLQTAIADPAPAISLWRRSVVHRQGDSMTVRLGSGDELVGCFAGLSAEGFLRLELADGERIITGGDVM